VAIMSTDKPDKPAGPGGRPPLSQQTKVITIVMPLELLQRVQDVTRKRAATIAGYVRQAIEEKLEREREREDA
jgi:predicted DNA-binding protein